MPDNENNTRVSFFGSSLPSRGRISKDTACYWDLRRLSLMGETLICSDQKDGKWREWLQTVPADEIMEVPCWLRPLSHDKYKFKGMKEGDGRNQDLYEYILIMQSKGYNREQIRKTH